jgi:hypothetical protein
MMSIPASPEDDHHHWPQTWHGNRITIAVGKSMMNQSIAQRPLVGYLARDWRPMSSIASGSLDPSILAPSDEGDMSL